MKQPNSFTSLIIAIDGPSGAGKSTLARRLATQLGLKYLDTGALYRAAALKAKLSNLPLNDKTRLPRILAKTVVGLKRCGLIYQVFLDGKEVSLKIRTPEAAMAAAQIATNQAVRTVLAGWQRKFGKEGGLVAEGRDIGTVIFPKAEVKFFVTASIEERSHRRLKELQAAGERVSYAVVLRQTRRRDLLDRSRKVSPLKIAKDAILIDTTGLALEKVLAALLAKVKTRIA